MGTRTMDQVHALFVTFCIAAVSAAPVPRSNNDSSLVLSTFGTDAPTSKISWKEANDPVMGGQSQGNFSVVADHGVFQGTVKNVSFLHAPGFCQFTSPPSCLKTSPSTLRG